MLSFKPYQVLRYGAGWTCATKSGPQRSFHVKMAALDSATIPPQPVCRILKTVRHPFKDTESVDQVLELTGVTFFPSGSRLHQE
ncbi:hypothetical protein GDO81_024249 [Engystomops pustulosus]|uniref:Uncharacterized protein n=1 Tax=Engystomops pustulosus TaxID=76066 RepID=A0AAV6YK90_ENGPU|nr:hypothetical protein GDO81_024249 [Engystomops pustulosus]